MVYHGEENNVISLIFLRKFLQMKIIIIFLLVIFSSQLYSQKLKVYEVNNSDESPKLQWYESGKDLQAKSFKVWRTSLEENSFDSIQTIHYFGNQKKDTLIYTVLDTTLTEKAIYKYYISFEGKDRKSIVSDIVYGHNMGNIPSPRLKYLEVNSSKTKKAIELSWKLNHNFSVRTLSIFRSSHHEKDFVKIVDLAGDAESYTDNVPLSNHDYFYFILIADYFGYQHPSPPTPGFCSFNQKPYTPQKLKLIKLENAIELSWENLRSSLSGYKVYRAIGNEKFRPLHVMQTSNELKVSYKDTLPSTFENASVFRYYVVNYGDSYVKSNSSDTLSVFIEKIVALKPPNELDAHKQDNNRVKLIWSRPKNTDIMGYNIYLTNPTTKKLNTVIIPKNQNYFIDTTNYKSGRYMFEVESVGKDNQVSEFRMKTSCTIFSPNYHLVVDTKKIPTAFDLIWKALPIEQIVSISLYRQEEEQTPVLLQKFDNKDTKYSDSQLTKGKSYYYTFYADLVTGEKTVINDKITLRF